MRTEQDNIFSAVCSTMRRARVRSYVRFVSGARARLVRETSNLGAFNLLHLAGAGSLHIGTRYRGGGAGDGMEGWLCRTIMDSH